MPVKEFSGDATVRIQDGAGGYDNYPLPFSDGRVIAKPDRPKGPPFRTLVDGRRKERRSDGWYLDVKLQWEELSKSAHVTLRQLIDDLHQRSSSQAVEFKPEPDSGSSISYWRVVPAIKEGTIDLIYEDRVRSRKSSFMLKARQSRESLPNWFE